ncbi:MAG: prepilin-type N-terminal cleavage/methylation domain-containing protein, partial [Candidatus Abyssobacteria bacterium SURF_17]
MRIAERFAWKGRITARVFSLICEISVIRGSRKILLMRKNGYTFAEMLVVVAIIALMMVIMIPRLAFQQRGA